MPEKKSFNVHIPFELKTRMDEYTTRCSVLQGGLVRAAIEGFLLLPSDLQANLLSGDLERAAAAIKTALPELDRVQTETGQRLLPHSMASANRQAAPQPPPAHPHKKQR